jgi:hypothetical protein
LPNSLWRCFKSESERSSIALRLWNPSCNRWWEGKCFQTRKSKRQGKSLLVRRVGSADFFRQNNVLGLACLL